MFMVFHLLAFSAECLDLFVFFAFNIIIADYKMLRIIVIFVCSFVYFHIRKVFYIVSLARTIHIFFVKKRDM